MRSLVAFVPVVVACGPTPLTPRDPTPGAFHFTIETYNVAAPNFGDVATREAIGYSNADIVCLQETGSEWQPVIEARYENQYPYRLYHAVDGSGGLTALSKFPITDGGIIPSPNGWHPSWLLHVETQIGMMDVLNVHLRAILSGRSSGAEAYLTVDSDHAQEIRIFAATVNPSNRTLVVGDFNEEPSGPAVSYLETQGFADALPLFHPGQPTWHEPSVGGQLEKMLDHVLFDANFAPLNSWVLRRGNSDHQAVLAHLEVTEPTL
ncbi:MAG TPA: endonuclease/exonuclease/phosphatase family protein [Polyangiaceae bacterium]|nr:endonuclease/exonuclease/phosphatase family protein [Polyangiaceae bacterium]